MPAPANPWVVWCPRDRWMPSVEAWHATKPAAMQAARRLARDRPGASFLVLRVAAEVVRGINAQETSEEFG